MPSNAPWHLRPAPASRLARAGQSRTAPGSISAHGEGEERAVGRRRAPGADGLAEGRHRQRRPPRRSAYTPAPARRVRGDVAVEGERKEHVAAGRRRQPQAAGQQPVVQVDGALVVERREHVHRVDDAERRVGDQLAGLDQPGGGEEASRSPSGNLDWDGCAYPMVAPSALSSSHAALLGGQSYGWSEPWWPVWYVAGGACGPSAWTWPSRSLRYSTPARATRSDVDHRSAPAYSSSSSRSYTRLPRKLPATRLARCSPSPACIRAASRGYTPGRRCS